MNIDEIKKNLGNGRDNDLLILVGDSDRKEIEDFFLDNGFGCGKYSFTKTFYYVRIWKSEKGYEIRSGSELFYDVFVSVRSKTTSIMFEDIIRYDINDEFDVMFGDII